MNNSAMTAATTNSPFGRGIQLTALIQSIASLLILLVGALLVWLIDAGGFMFVITNCLVCWSFL
ncbi:MAG: hypothetical protein O7F73_06070 [Gammaproteobacteria bacterium]|nr:hypothetical protein [Gammaproteobacteria bacterium]